MENKNALAELVTNLGMIYAENLSNDFYCDNISKALRIITELAKVRVTHLGTACIADCINGYFKCRAIAEEGV